MCTSKNNVGFWVVVFDFLGNCGSLVNNRTSGRNTENIKFFDIARAKFLILKVETFDLVALID